MRSLSRLLLSTMFVALLAQTVAGDVPGQLSGQAFEDWVRKQGKTILEKATTFSKPPDDAINLAKAGGLTPSLAQDPAGAINAAINANRGKALFVPPGEYLLTDSIRPVDGTRLYLHPKARMLRGFEGGNGGSNGALVQGDPDISPKEVLVKGGT